MYPQSPASYRLTHTPSGIFYVGSTNNLARRIGRHKTELNGGTHHSKPLQSIFTRWEDIRVEFTLTENPEDAQTNEERELRDNRESPLLANVGRGVKGPWVGGVPAEQRAKMTEGLRRYHQRPEVRERMRAQATGHVHSAEHKRAISDSLKGIVRSDETKLKLSIARRQAVERLRQTYGGKSISPERSAQISAHHSRPVIAAGVRYPSATAAAKAHGVVTTTVTNRIRSTDPKFSNWTLAD